MRVRGSAVAKFVHICAKFIMIRRRGHAISGLAEDGLPEKMDPFWKNCISVRAEGA